MPSKRLAVSPAVAHLLRDRRRSLGLTLRGVEALSRESGNPIPHSTLARIELGRFDPGVRRLRQLLELYQLPIQAAGDVLDIEALAGATPIERSPTALRDRALDAWRRGRIAEALASFLEFRRRVPNDDEHRGVRHEAILAFSVAASSLGKLHLARHMLDELLLDEPEPRMLVPILIQQSVIWRSLGSPIAALAFVDSAAAHALPDSPKHLGWVQHQRALVLIEMREFAAAGRSLALAVRHHRRARSPHDEALALLSMARLGFEEGRGAAALLAARRAERFAARHGFERVRSSALVEQARALTACGSTEQARKVLRAVLADSMVAEDHLLSFYAHFYLWQAERASGNDARSDVELREAAYYLKYVDQSSSEASVVRREMAARPRAPARSPGRPRRRGPRGRPRRSGTPTGAA